MGLLCEKGTNNVLNAIQMGILTASTKDRLEQLEAQQEALKTGILQAQMERPKYSKEEIVGWISRFKYGNIHDRKFQKEIIDTFVNAVYVFDDKIVFTYNYKDGTVTLTLQEIEAAFGSDFTNFSPPKKPSKWVAFFFLPEVRLQMHRNAYSRFLLDKSFLLWYTFNV